MLKDKVFCLGFQKTSTTSIGKALTFLGYQVCGYYPFRDFDKPGEFDEIAFIKRLFDLADTHDGFKDTPWPVFYKELDERYQGSKFILIIRNTDSWIKSVVQDFQAWGNAIHNYIYGVPFPQGHEDVFIERYETHNREVQEYFSNRPNDLLVLHLNKGEVNWKSICDFLGVDTPDRDWPRANTLRKKQIKTFVNKLRNKFTKIFSPSV